MASLSQICAIPYGKGKAPPPPSSPADPSTPRQSRAAGSGGRRASDFGRMNFIEKFTALLDYIEYAGLNHFGTESD